MREHRLRLGHPIPKPVLCGVFDEPLIHAQTLALFSFNFSRLDLEYLPGARQGIK